MTSPVREMLRVWRNRHDNPVVAASDPRRRGWRGVAHLFAFLGAFILLPYIALLPTLPYRRTAELTYFWFILLAWIALGAATVLTDRFAFRRRELGELQELDLSLLSREEVAFGAVWWPFLFVLVTGVGLAGCQVMVELLSARSEVDSGTLIRPLLIITIAVLSFLVAASRRMWRPGRDWVALLKCMGWLALVAHSSWLCVEILNDLHAPGAAARFSTGAWLLGCQLTGLGVAALLLREFAAEAPASFFQAVDAERNGTDRVARAGAGSRARLHALRESYLLPLLLTAPVLAAAACGIALLSRTLHPYAETKLGKDFVVDLLTISFSPLGALVLLLLSVIVPTALASALGRLPEVRVVPEHRVRSFLAVAGSNWLLLLMGLLAGWFVLGSLTMDRSGNVAELIAQSLFIPAPVMLSLIAGAHLMTCRSIARPLVLWLAVALAALGLLLAIPVEFLTANATMGSGTFEARLSNQAVFLLILTTLWGGFVVLPPLWRRAGRAADAR